MKKIIVFITILIAVVIMNNNTYSQSSDLSFSDATYTLKIDYTKTIGELITACNFGNFDSCIINKKKTPATELVDSVVEVSAKLINFKCEWISSDDAIAEMNQADYRPATVFELVAFAEKYYHKAKKKFIIIALGSLCRFNIGSSAPGLHFDDGLYQLDLFSDVPIPFWPTSVFSFLAIRK